MRKLVKLQLRNLFSLKSFYICTSLGLLNPILALITGIVLKKPNTFMPEAISVMSSAGLTLTIAIVLFTCLDYSDGTVKNIIARGYTRKQFLLSKYIVSLIIAFIMYLLGIVLCFILFIKNGVGYESNMIYEIFGYIFQTFALVAFYVVLSNMFEKTGASIVATIVGPMFLNMGFAMATLFLKLKFSLSDYWVDGIVNHVLVKNPDIVKLLIVLGLAVFYTVGLLLLGIYVGKRKEVK